MTSTPIRPVTPTSTGVQPLLVPPLIDRDLAIRGGSARGRPSEREIIVEGTKIRACGRGILKNEALSVLLHARLFV
jgi:hypothetical protein